MSTRRAWAWGSAGTAALLLTLLVLSRTTLLHARLIEVAGASHLSTAQVLRIAGVSESSNLLWLDTENAERRLEATTWIADSEVTVEFPFTLSIQVTERVPVAVATDGVRDLLLAADGTWLGDGARRGGLPQIRFLRPGMVEGPAPGPQGAAEVLGAMDEELRASVTTMNVGLDGTLEIRLRGATWVRFGTPDRVSAKVGAIERALVWARAEGLKLRTLTVTAPDAPAAVLT